VQEPGIVFAECLADLDRNRKALAGLGEKFSRVFDLINAVLQRGGIDSARTMIECNRSAVMSLCELATSSAEQQIVLALKLAEVTYSGHTGLSQPALRGMEQTVDKFVYSALAYLDGECDQASPAAGTSSPDTPTDPHSKEQTL
jgi:hypothetical protein